MCGFANSTPAVVGVVEEILDRALVGVPGRSRLLGRRRHFRQLDVGAGGHEARQPLDQVDDDVPSSPARHGCRR